MSRILVTLLGKVFNNYRSANYNFGDDNIRTSRFFGLSLCEQIKPDKLIVLGTTGSMWNNLLLETELKHQPDLENDLLSLGDDAKHDKVTQSTLNTLAQRLESVLQIDCELTLIPYGHRQQEQIDTLKILVDSFEEQDTAILDVTNGLRHLPMLIQQSALLLQTLKKVHIEDIYYGALDLTSTTEPPITPVMKLNGLLEIDRWNQALQHYDKDGDYSAFVDLFSHTGLSHQGVQALSYAAFYEQTNNIGQARHHLRHFLTLLKDEEESCDEHIKLFLPALKERFAWVNEEKLHTRQTEIAWLCLDNDNLIRACIYGFEAFITRLVEDNNGNPDHYAEREKVKFQCKDFGYSKTVCAKYFLLKDIRNQFAHGYTNDKITKITANPMLLMYTLGDIFTAIIPKKSELLIIQKST